MDGASGWFESTLIGRALIYGGPVILLASLAYFAFCHLLLERIQRGLLSTEGRPWWSVCTASQLQNVLSVLSVGPGAFLVGWFWRDLGWYMVPVGLYKAVHLNFMVDGLFKSYDRWLKLCKSQPCTEPAIDLIPKSQPLPWQEPPRPKYGPLVGLLTGPLSPVSGRVHLDECASSSELEQMLTDHGLEVTLTQDVGLLKATDLRQLEYAIANRAVIVTHDKDFLHFHKQGRTHAGIVLTPPHPVYYTEIVRICLRMAGEVAEECGTAKSDS